MQPGGEANDDKFNLLIGSVKKCRNTLGKIDFTVFLRKAVKKCGHTDSHVRSMIRAKIGEDMKKDKDDIELSITSIHLRDPNGCFIKQVQGGKWFPKKIQGTESSVVRAFTRQNHYETLMTALQIYEQNDSSQSFFKESDETEEVMERNAPLELAEEDNTLLRELIGCAAPTPTSEEKDINAFPMSKPPIRQSTKTTVKNSLPPSQNCTVADGNRSGIYMKEIDASDSSKQNPTRFFGSSQQVDKISNARSISGAGSIERRFLVSSCA